MTNVKRDESERGSDSLSEWEILAVERPNSGSFILAQTDIFSHLFESIAQLALQNWGSVAENLCERGREWKEKTFEFPVLFNLF